VGISPDHSPRPVQAPLTGPRRDRYNLTVFGGLSHFPWPQAASADTFVSIMPHFGSHDGAGRSANPCGGGE
jgi:hypothetical protein